MQRKARILNTKKPGNKKRTIEIFETEKMGLHLKQSFEWRASKIVSANTTPKGLESKDIPGSGNDYIFMLKNEK